MAVYSVDFTITLSTCKRIEAESSEQALRVASLLLESYDFYEEELVPDWNEWWAGWDMPNDPMIVHKYPDGEKPEYTREEMARFICMEDLED